MNQLVIKGKEELNRKRKKGFTLVELIIVIAIIAILAAIAIPKFGTIKEDANKKSDIATAKTIATIAAKEIASGNIVPAATDTSVTVTSSELVGKQLDGNIAAKSKDGGDAKTFNYIITTDGNIKVVYTSDATKILFPQS